MKECYLIKTPMFDAKVWVEKGKIIDSDKIWKRFKGVNFNKFVELLERQHNGDIKWKKIG